ncbi:MAG: hypothetical protein IPP55_10110 [Anaerolineales bacterium]|nr:hypothetical protein [Anaerolineales bacterium]
MENNALMFWGVFVLFAIVLASVLFFQGGAIFEPAKTQVVSTSTDTKTGEPSKTQMPTLALTYKSRGFFLMKIMENILSRCFSQICEFAQ